MSAPIETVWPVGVTAVLWAAVAWRLRGQIRMPRWWWLLALVAVGVRLFWIPAWTAHAFDGHEAEYWDLFRGMKSPTRGGTVMVPGMQWFWWLLGHVLPASERLVVALMVVVGAASIGLTGGAIGLAGGRLAGWLAAWLLVFHGAHAAWSSSAYNVILPHFFSAAALFGAAASVRGRAGPWRSLVVLSIALSLALRMDTGTIGLAVAALVLFCRPDGATLVERLRRWAGPGLICAAITAACVWPMLWPGSLPGAGERTLSFSLNRFFWAPYHPFDRPVVAVCAAAVAVQAIRRHAALALVLVGWLVIHHGMMATFDDFGERHALVVAPALAGLLGLGLASMSWLGVAGLGLFVGFSALNVQDIAERFYGSEERYAAVLEQPPYADLPRVEWPGTPPKDCGWIAEDARVAARPIASHFNVLNPEEEAELRGSAGCLKWCVDVQDWRWSSRGVRDRALRLDHLFELHPAAVVVDPSTGYACLSMDVGHRTRTDTRPNDGNHGSTSRNDHAVP